MELARFDIGGIAPKQFNLLAVNIRMVCFDSLQALDNRLVRLVGFLVIVLSCSIHRDDRWVKVGSGSSDVWSPFIALVG